MSPINAPIKDLKYQEDEKGCRDLIFICCHGNEEARGNTKMMTFQEQNVQGNRCVYATIKINKKCRTTEMSFLVTFLGMKGKDPNSGL